LQPLFISQTTIEKRIRVTEENIIRGCMQNNAACQRMLFDTYAGKMLSVCYRYTGNQHDAEDILQEAFIKIFAHIHQFKWEGSFEGWLRRIVVNTALKALQKKKIHFAEVNETTSGSIQVEPDTFSSLQIEQLMGMLKKLPDGYRVVFNLYVIEGYDHEEIAKMLNIQASTSRSQLVKARKMLQQQIKNDEKIAI
jgi:RNA polymerase sigma-70 factor (ECF subfamily)